MAGRHWLAPILADWKAGIQQEDAVKEAAALAELEAKIEQEMAAADLQVRQELAAAITRQVDAAKQTLRVEMAQIEGRLREYVRSQSSSSADGDRRAPGV